MAGAGVNPAWLNMIRRDDGSTQLTYNQWQLYYFSGDAKPGDMNGQGAAGVWWAVFTTGQGITTIPVSTAPTATAPAVTAAPSALPRTGDVLGDVLPLTSVAGVVMAVADAWLRRRTAA